MYNEINWNNLEQWKENQNFVIQGKGRYEALSKVEIISSKKIRVIEKHPLFKSNLGLVRMYEINSDDPSGKIKGFYHMYYRNSISKRFTNYLIRHIKE